MGVRSTFADVGATIAENFQVQLPEHGVSFLTELKIKERRGLIVTKAYIQASEYIQEKYRA